MSNVKNLRDGTLTLFDGSGSPKSLVVTIMEGDVSFDVELASVVILNRGVIDSRKQTDDVPVSVSFSFYFNQWQYASQASTGLSPVGALMGEADAVAAAWVSTDACGPWAVDLHFAIANPCNAGEKETLTFIKFHADKIAFKEGKDMNKITVSGKALTTKPTRAYA